MKGFTWTEAAPSANFTVTMGLFVVVGTSFFVVLKGKQNKHLRGPQKTDTPISVQPLMFCDQLCLVLGPVVWRFLAFFKRPESQV